VLPPYSLAYSNPHHPSFTQTIDVAIFTNGSLKQQTIMNLSKFFYSPTDAQVICLENNFKFTLKLIIKQLRHVSVQSHHHQGAHCAVTPSSGSALCGHTIIRERIVRSHYHQGAYCAVTLSSGSLLCGHTIIRERIVRSHYHQGAHCAVTLSLGSACNDCGTAP
jgi:hypothetical protein